MDQSYRKRSRSNSPPPWHRKAKSPRHNYEPSTSNRKPFKQRGKEIFPREHARRNQELEDARMRDWKSNEDDFVLKQSKKKAKIRVKEGRAKPIDRLAVILSVVDPVTDLLEDNSISSDLNIINPSKLVEDLTLSELKDVEKDIDHYLALEHDDGNRTYWEVCVTTCRIVGFLLTLVGFDDDLQV
jgi:hypothetical protein